MRKALGAAFEPVWSLGGGCSDRGVLRAATKGVGRRSRSREFEQISWPRPWPSTTARVRPDDPTAFVELERVFHDIVVEAGKTDLLVQSFTDEHEHFKLATPEYAALLRAMTA